MPSPASAERELELLFACARPETNPADFVTSDLDWTRLLSLAGANGMRPLLYSRLREVRPEIGSLGGWFEANARQNLALTAELLRILRSLQDAKIEAVPFKGPALAAQLYGSLALRECSDLDLLIKPADVLAAKQVLLASGYTWCQPLAADHERAFLRSGCEFNFEKTAGPCVDVHWQPAPAHFCISMPDAMWMHVHPLPLPIAELLVLAPEDLLVLLCIHGAKHLWRKVIWISDVAALARIPSLNWDAALRRASEMRARRMIWWGLALAAELLDVPLPFKLTRAYLRDAVARVRRDLLQAADPMLISISDHRQLVSMRDGWSDKARYCTRLAFTLSMADWELLRRWPSVPAGMYRIVRLGRLAGKLVRPQRPPAMECESLPNHAPSGT